MMKRQIEVEINPMPREIEAEIWEMDSLQQADLVLALAQRYRSNPGKLQMQLEYVKDEVKVLLDPEERRDAVRLFELIVEYLKDAEEQ